MNSSCLLNIRSEGRAFMKNAQTRPSNPPPPPPPASAGPRVGCRWVQRVVEAELGRLHPLCFNGPYLTAGLVFSGAKTPFSLGQLGERARKPLAL